MRKDKGNEFHSGIMREKKIDYGLGIKKVRTDIVNIKACFILTNKTPGF